MAFKQLLPSELLQQLRRIRGKLRHLRWRVRMTFNRAVIGQEDIVKQLRALGVSEGQDLLVHSSLSQIGLVDGGADAVVDALLQAIGKSGTLLMPAYAMMGSMLETMKSSCPFNVAETPSTMGKITEALRLRPGSIRSAHPTHSVVAWGPRAAMYVERHHLSRFPFGPQSPFWLLADYGGAILCLGTGIAKVTSHHVTEDKVDNYPLRVYLPDIYRKTVFLSDGTLIDVETLVHDPSLAPIRMDSNKQHEMGFMDDMRKAGIVREGMIGQAKSYLFDATALNKLCEKRLVEGKTGYATI